MTTPTRAALLSVFLAAAPALAGPLDPPPGPVAPTHKTLTQIEPRTPVSVANTPGDADSSFKITQPGAYYLTGDIIGRAGFAGIRIAASNVTLDLMGFTVQGVASSLTGIVSDGAHGGITIRNGVVTGWGVHGIDLNPTGAGLGSLIENIRSTDNALIGIRGRPHSIIRACFVEGNGNTGISAPLNSIVENCTALNSGAAGIQTGVGSVVSGSTAQGNALTGISVGNGSTIRGCTAVSNGGGISSVGGTSVIVNCVARSNTFTGIFASSGSTVSGCSAFNNGKGFILEAAAAFDCFANGNNEVGFEATFGASLSRCSAMSNGLSGITLANNCSATDCTTRANGQSGDGAGVLATGTDNVIAGGNHTANDWGVRVTGTGNLVVRVSCSGNTTHNFDIAAGNRYGPIINITAATAPAASGNAAADSTSTTHPWANFAY